MFRVDDERPPITPQLALRVAVLGGIALAVFAVIFFRLWYLQILSGDRYLHEANNNRIREIKVQAPRGKILDRNGEVLVENRTGLAVQIQAQRLPKAAADRELLYRRLGRVIEMRPSRIRREIRQQIRRLPYSAVTLRQDVPYSDVFYLQENQDRFPGVSVERIFLRRYPRGTLAAHLFGNVGEITRPQLRQKRYRRLQQGDRVGQSGVEYEYDRYLRGVNGATRVQVDSLGRPKSLGNGKGEVSVVQAVSGDNLRLAVDAGVQKAGEAALQGFGKPGGFVAMDVRSGEVLGLGSFPTFNPAVFSRPLSQSTYRQLTSRANGAPLADRAIQGLYPTGSTFKLITSTAALESGVITPDTPLFDGGSLKVGGVTFRNAGHASFGTLSLRRALQVSSDVFFYRVGQMAEGHGGEIIQKWARRLGLGARTGIDLPAEGSGLIPTPEWRNRLYRKGLTDRPWSVGDNINLAVGQGDVQADPIQMAVAYAALGNGGYVVRPHLGLRVEDAAGRTLQEIKPGPRRKLNIAPQYRDAILQGLHAAADSPGGTSYPVFQSFPIPVAGKTGTAERGILGDQSWYVVMAPYPHPKVVVAVTIERGGFGAEAAAPAARRILSEYFNVKLKARKGAQPLPGGVQQVRE
jgi:penicillin-binding protein 2